MRERNRNIDFYKGLLMFGVIWGHTITNLRNGAGTSVWILTFFRTYDMPFFMLISGYFLSFSMSKSKWPEVFVKRLFSLAVPLIVWEIILSLVSGQIFSSLKSIFSLWFLWSAFGCTYILILVCGLIPKQRIQILVLVLIIIALHLFPFTPFNLAYMLPFFVVGYYLNCLKISISDVNREKLYFLAIITFVVLQCYWKGSYNVWNAGTYVLERPSYTIPVIIFRGIIGALGCFVMKILFDCMIKCFPLKIVSFFVLVGQNTMLLYIMQSVVIESLLPSVVSLISGKIGFNIFVLNMRLLGYVLAPSLALIVIVGLLYVIQLIKKLPILSRVLCGVVPSDFALLQKIRKQEKQ